MPLYEYECEACAQRFERIRKFSDPPIDTCPSCNGPVRKLLSSPAIQFKGSGWYITDYPKKGSTDSAASAGGGDEKKAEKKATDSTGDSKSQTSDTKPPAAKAD